MQGFAQKTVYYFNFSSYALYIGDIITVKEVPPPAGSPIGTLPTYDYPLFRNTNAERGGTYITVNPGGSYTLENIPNPTKFPFISYGNTPQLNNWKRVSSATSTPAAITSIAAFTLATPQVFHYTKFMIGPGGSAGGTTLASPKPRLSGAGRQIDETPYTVSTIDLDGDSIVVMILDN